MRIYLCTAVPYYEYSFRLMTNLLGAEFLVFLGMGPQAPGGLSTRSTSAWMNSVQDGGVACLEAAHHLVPTLLLRLHV
jgi:hypothetical protein